ncbi:MAG TPA: carbohydrate-binding family 9-like protein [Bryobacteraceae bacterium]|nr:carbohydrate-binding family 9-like protein [Bryobacteraceae bacterium]
MQRLLLPLAAACALLAREPDVILSRRAAADFPLTANPMARQWKDTHGIFAENGPRGEAVPGHRTEIRSRWTRDNIYFLFICPYQVLNLKPNPSRTTETNLLWNWDVAEVFVGSDFKEITRYKEFEVSPQGEWVDLDIDRVKPLPEGGWLWNSGFGTQARIDARHKVWYGEMRIPLRSIDPRPPAEGLEMRINFYRCQGREPGRKFIAWQPTGEANFHVPQAFGLLKLVP